MVIWVLIIAPEKNDCIFLMILLVRYSAQNAAI